MQAEKKSSQHSMNFNRLNTKHHQHSQLPRLCFTPQPQLSPDHSLHYLRPQAYHPTHASHALLAQTFNKHHQNPLHTCGPWAGHGMGIQELHQRLVKVHDPASAPHARMRLRPMLQHWRLLWLLQQRHLQRRLQHWRLLEHRHCRWLLLLVLQLWVHVGPHEGRKPCRQRHPTILLLLCCRCCRSRCRPALLLLLLPPALGAPAAASAGWRLAWLGLPLGLR